MSIDPVYTAFQLQLDSANPTSLLIVAEAAGRAADPSVAANAAAIAVGTSLGYPPLSYDSMTRQELISFALTKLQSLQPLTQGPPKGNWYSWVYP
jgi:hypothetical protein